MVELGLDYRDYFEDILQDQKRQETVAMNFVAPIPAFNQTLNSTQLSSKILPNNSNIILLIIEFNSTI